MPMASFPQIPEFYSGNGTSPLFQAVWLENGPSSNRIDVPSNESGASRADGVQRDTALGTFYNFASIQRLICGNDQRVTELVEQFLHSSFLSPM